MKLPVRSLSALSLAALALGLSGCIVIPAHRYYGPPRVGVVVHGESDRGHHHHGREAERGYYRYDGYEGQGPYRR